MPEEFIDATSLLGPPARIADRMADLAAAGVTTLSVTPHGHSVEERIATLRVAADALDKSGAAG